MRCLKERGAGDDRQIELMSRLEALTATSPWAENPFVANLFVNMRRWTPAESAEAGGLPTAIHGLLPVTATFVQYEEIIRALAGADFPLDMQRPLVLQDLTVSQYKHLAELLDPGMDYRHVMSTSEPAVRFMAGGYMIGAAYVNHVDNRRDLRVAIRPAVAAANRFNILIPWHRELLHDANYEQSFLGCLAALEDPDRWYEELVTYGDVVLPGIGDVARVAPILKYVDVRMIPWLERYSGSGTDAFMEVLCTMASRIDAPEIDPVLTALFYRWVGRFDHKSPGLQHAENHPLWRAFSRLSGHPRFTLIQDYEIRLSTIRHMLIPWYHKKAIVQVLMRSARSYTEIESMLFRAADFEHRFEDEVDRLDDAADRLFHQLLEED
jgi:hypothetical protein